MKEANRAPFYAALYPGLCDIARKHGYCLAIHGSMVTDLDLVAAPWTDDTPAPEAMVEEMKAHLGALFYPDLLRRNIDEKNVQGILEHQKYEGEPKAKPHGRRAWSLHLDRGSYIDLSVMPRMLGGKTISITVSQLLAVASFYAESDEEPDSVKTLSVMPEWLCSETREKCPPGLYAMDEEYPEHGLAGPFDSERRATDEEKEVQS